MAGWHMPRHDGDVSTTLDGSTGRTVVRYLFTRASDEDTWRNVKTQNGTCPEQVKTRSNLLLRDVWHMLI